MVALPSGFKLNEYLQPSKVVHIFYGSVITSQRGVAV